VHNVANSVRVLIWNRHGHECSRIWKLSGNFTLIQCIKKCRDFLSWDILGTTFFLGPNLVSFKWLLLHMGSVFKWYRTYERGYETSGSPWRFMLRRSSLVECVSVLHGTCLQSVDFFLFVSIRAAMFVKKS
jgi:hypothetical protein